MMIKMNPEQNIIEACGLSTNQAKIYLALVEMGTCTVTQISSSTKIHRSNIYDALDQLVEKGLVSYILDNNETKQYEANTPDLLLSLIEEKQKNLRKIIPRLKLKSSMSNVRSRAHTLEGLKGMRTVLEDMVASTSRGGNFFAFGIPSFTPEKLKFFLKKYHEDRIEKQISMYHLYNENAKDRIEFLESLPFTRATFLPKEYDAPSTTLIYEGKVAFFIWEPNPLAIIIESAPMAESYERYFKLLWKIATNEELKTNLI